MNNQQNFQQGTIDDRFFVPLSEFFLNDRYDPDELLRFILATGHPKKNLGKSVARYIGFGLEAYVKWSLKRFDTTGHLSPNRFMSGTLKNSYQFNTDNWGNIEFYNPRDQRRHTIAEIDGLYEYHDGASVTPVVFEISFRKGSSDRIMFKGKLIGELYGSLPYLCKVRPQRGDESPGLYREHGYNHRKILIPSSQTFDVLGTRLFNLF